MSARCKPGDLAVILYDLPGCERNIGRLVIVRGPSAIDYKGQLTWLITPVTPDPYIIDNPASGEFRFMEPGELGIEHPDDWMLPVHPVYPDETEDETLTAPEHELATLQ